MKKLYRVNEANYWNVDRDDLNNMVIETTPENLLHLLDLQGKYRVDDLAEGCRSYGLRPSSWEYMWQALHEGLNELFQVSAMLDGLVTNTRLTTYPLKLETNWRWEIAGWFPKELFYITDSGRDGFSMDWPVTTSVVLLSLELNPSRVLHFVKACAKATKWIVEGGERPDMKFPEVRDPQKAYEILSGPIMLKELGE